MFFSFWFIVIYVLLFVFFVGCLVLWMIEYVCSLWVILVVVLCNLVWLFKYVYVWLVGEFVVLVVIIMGWLCGWCSIIW